MGYGIYLAICNYGARKPDTRPRLCPSASENYGFRRFNLIQKFRIAGTISLPRYPRNIMS